MRRLVLTVMAVGALMLTVVLAGCSGTDTSNAADAASSSAADAADRVGDAASSAAQGLGGAASDARDAGFLGVLDAGNLKFGGSDSDVVDTARDTCASLRDASNARDVSSRLAQRYDGDESKARNFVRAAVSAYCPTEIAKLVY